jgi:hypothetical protein
MQSGRSYKHKHTKMKDATRRAKSENGSKQMSGIVVRRRLFVDTKGCRTLVMTNHDASPQQGISRAFFPQHQVNVMPKLFIASKSSGHMEFFLSQEIHDASIYCDLTASVYAISLCFRKR